MKKIIFLAFMLGSFSSLYAQTKKEQSGWLFFLNSTKFNEKWGMHLDVQVRSADDWAAVKNVLIRPGLTYYINKQQNVTAGYLLASTDNGQTTYEHRIWEQYIINHKLAGVLAAHRFRLEQRFLPNDIFAQRLRYFIRLIQPLKKQADGFSKGAFVALQNEIFLNIQHQDKLNGSLFDQNRLYLAAGYRFSKKLDLEAGYLNQAINGRLSNTTNHIAQFAIYTRF